MAIMGAAPAIMRRMFDAAAEAVTRSCTHELAVNDICLNCGAQLNPMARR